MAIQRRTAQAPTPMAQAPPPPPTYAPPAQQQQLTGAAPGLDGPNFLDLAFYSSGFLVPQGHYVMTDLTTMLFKGEKQREEERKLGVMITFVPLNDPRQENAKTQFYSMGTEAHKSFMPNPAHGKGIVPIAGAPSAGLTGMTNWNLFLKSLYDCNLPHGIATNRLDALEGTWVYIAHIDEPAERKAFQSNTAEVQSAPRVDKKMAVVGEILDGGKPWEGTGGWPAAPIAVGAAPVHVHTPANKVNGAPAPQAPSPPAQHIDMADIRGHAMNAIADVLEACTKAGQPVIARLKLRNDTFNLLVSKSGEATAGAVLSQVFDTPGVLDTVVGDLGYKVAGMMVQPS